MIHAAWWEPLDNGQVACTLCPVGCRLRPGQDGPCGTRTNRDGVMNPLHYGQLVSLGLDPIEKKPLYHFFPGRAIMSAAAPGCNLHCQFCQNWSISQGKGQGVQEVDPGHLAQMAQAEDSVGLAYTYSEPLVWYEFVRDTGQAVHAIGLKNVLVTNGFLNRDPLEQILPLIDAANIDLKSMDDRFYRKICQASLEPVLAAIDQFLAAGVHVELTNLVIPGQNDSPEQIEALVDFVAEQEKQHQTAIPLHFSAYRPAWKMKEPATPVETLLRARDMAQRKLQWVYLGNLTGPEGRDTCCPNCHEPVVERSGYEARVSVTREGTCPGCEHELPLVLV